jgi:hypothetical protein
MLAWFGHSTLDDESVELFLRYNSPMSVIAPARLVLRVSRRQRIGVAFAIIISIAAFLVTPASPIGFGKLAPGKELLGILFFAGTFGTFALLGIWALIFQLRHRLVIDEQVIAIRNWFGSKSMNLATIETATWTYTPYIKSLVLSDGQQRLKIVIENYSRANRVRLIEKLRQLIPDARKIGWERIDRLYLRPPTPGANRRLIWMIARACVVGAGCNVLIIVALRVFYPYWTESTSRLLFVTLVASLAFPLILGILAAGNWLLTALTGEDG